MNNGDISDASDINTPLADLAGGCANVAAHCRRGHGATAKFRRDARPRNRRATFQAYAPGLPPLPADDRRRQDDLPRPRILCRGKPDNGARASRRCDGRGPCRQLWPWVTASATSTIQTADANAAPPAGFTACRTMRRPAGSGYFRKCSCCPRTGRTLRRSRPDNRGQHVAQGSRRRIVDPAWVPDDRTGNIASMLNASGSADLTRPARMGDVQRLDRNADDP